MPAGDTGIPFSFLLTAGLCWVPDQVTYPSPPPRKTRNEFYIVTVSSGSGSYGDVLAFASNKDKSLSLVHFPDVQEGDERFTGYLGHDTFTIADGGLVRSFPIYLPSDTNNKPTGGTRAIIYKLYPGEAVWQLRIDHVSELENGSEN